MYIETSDILSILSILINSILIIYVAYKIQNDINNIRFFKDYVIGEIKSLKFRTCDFLDDLEKGNLTTKIIQTTFISLINEHDALNSILNSTYKLTILANLNSKILSFQSEIEENVNYQRNFKFNKKWQPNVDIKNSLYELRGDIMIQAHQLNYQINNHKNNEKNYLHFIYNMFSTIMHKRPFVRKK